MADYWIRHEKGTGLYVVIDSLTNCEVCCAKTYDQAVAWVEKQEEYA